MPPAESNETPKYNLPPPIMEVGDEASKEIEKSPEAPELAKNVKAPKVNNTKTQISDFQLAAPAASQPQSDDSSTTLSANPQIAEDTDLIEKEWVAKAKKIIEANREDPYNQSKEITLFRADYMKKRYNKVIKVGE